MNDSDRSDDWKQQETVIAIEGNNPGEWQYLTYPNWDEAMEAVKVARRQGKQQSSTLEHHHLYHLSLNSGYHLAIKTKVIAWISVNIYYLELLTS